PISTGSGCDRGEWVGVSGPGGLVGAEPGAATHGGASLCGTGPSTLPPHRVAEGYARRCSVRRTLNTRREENMMAGNRRGSVRRAVAGAVVALLALAGCGADGLSERGDGDVPTVLTTFTVLQDIAQNVAGEHLEIESITKIGAEIHGYEPTPRDGGKASEADLILDNGLHLESWFEKFVDSADVPHVVVSDGIEVLDITGDADAGTPNPHAWTSPQTAQIYEDTTVAATSGLDPEHAQAYEDNAAAYKRELRTIQDDLVAEVETLPESERALVTCEGAFSYLARDVGLEEHYIWPVNAEQQATPQQIAGLIET